MTIDTLYDNFLFRTKAKCFSQELFIEKAILCGFKVQEIREFILNGTVFNTEETELFLWVSLHTSYN
jgi:hypothetical protein